LKDLRSVMTRYKTIDELKKAMLCVLETGVLPVIKEKKEEEKEKQGSSRTQKKSSAQERVEFITPFIEKGKFTKSELAEKLQREFSDVKLSTLVTMLVDGKNPKYNKFDNLIIEDEEKIMSFKK
jgi:hypothetical protein